MSNMLNIGGENAGDAFYRYKMPKLVARIEGRGNGIKTNVVNNVDIAKALERPAEYVIKFFGCELGAQTKFDKKAGTSIINGAHDASKLSEMLEGFIKKYVQCYSCGNPETVVKIKRENIYLKCKACGFVSEVDPGLRLNTFIIKNPPENKLSKAEKKVKKAEKDRLKGLEDPTSGISSLPLVADEKDKSKSKSKKKKSSSKKKGDDKPEDSTAADDDADDDNDDDEDTDNDNEDEDDVVWMTDTSETAMRKRAEEQLSSATAAMVTQGNVEAEREAAKRREEKRKAEEAAAQAAAEAEAKKKKEMEEAARLAAKETKELNLSNDSSSSSSTSVRTIKAAIDRGASPKEVADAVAKISGGPALRMKALYEALFGDLVDNANERVSTVLMQKKKYVQPHAGDQAGQLAQLVALEYILGVVLERSREALLVLKVMYDEDLVDEDLIVAWYSKKDSGGVLGVGAEAAAAVRVAAKPFVDWLEEEDSDDDDESDEE